MMKPLNFFWSFLCLVVIQTTSIAQSTIAGKITNESGDGLIGANILLKGTLEGTTTDADGFFELRTSASFPLELEISYTGYTAQIISLDAPSNDLKVILQGDLSLDEVLIVAQKREQSQQVVPIAVTAYDAELMRERGIDDISDLNQSNPSYQINVLHNKIANNPIRIRGIGNNGTNAGFEGAVGVYIDGVYRSRPGMALQVFNDIGGLEILRGPQGTLFGKNNTAGAMVFKSTAPSTEATTGGLEITAGNFSAVKVNGNVNVPLSKKAAFRLSGVYSKADGFMKNAVTDESFLNTDQLAFKAQFLVEPTEKITLKIIADMTNAEGRCCYGQSTRLVRDPALDAVLPDGQGGSFGLYESFATSNGFPYYNVGDSRAININQAGTNDTRDRGVLLNAEIELNDQIALKSISSFRSFKDEQGEGDWDFGPYDFGRDYIQNYDFQTFTQEINLTGKLSLGEQSSLDYVVGGFFSNEKLEHVLEFSTGDDLGANWQILFGPDFPVEQLAAPGGNVFRGLFNQDNNVAAGFAHLAFDLSEQFKLFGGFRLSSETKELDFVNRTLGENHTAEDYLGFLLGTQFGFLAGAPGAVGTAVPFATHRLEETESTYTAGLQYFPAQKTQIYFNYSRGWKAGGISLNQNAFTGFWFINADGAPELAPVEPYTFDPEFVNSYELGLKTDYNNSQGRLNIAAFFTDYENLQFNSFDGTTFLTGNASGATILGVEVENTYKFSQKVQSTLALTWLPTAEFDEEVSPSLEQLNLQGLAGRRQQFAPELALNFGLSFKQPISDKLLFKASTNILYRGEHFISQDVDLTEEYTLLNFNVGLKDRLNRWEVFVFVRNAADAEYKVFGYLPAFNFTALLTQGEVNPHYINLGPPRTFGVTLRYVFFKS